MALPNIWLFIAWAELSRQDYLKHSFIPSFFNTFHEIQVFWFSFLLMIPSRTFSYIYVFSKRDIWCIDIFFNLIILILSVYRKYSDLIWISFTLNCRPHAPQTCTLINDIFWFPHPISNTYSEIRDFRWSLNGNVIICNQ